MLQLAPIYEEKLAQANVRPLIHNAKCAMYSSVCGRSIDASECTPSYWKQNMVSTVNFQAALGECIGCHPGVAAIAEIGPRAALKGPAQESLNALGKSTVPYLPTCIRGEKSFEILLSSAGIMIGFDLPLQISNINARGIVNDLCCHYEPGKILPEAPSYQWNHSQGFWAESRVSRNIRFRRFPRHQLLGSRYVDDIPNRPSWRNQFMLREIPWLQELKVCTMVEACHFF